MTEDDLKAIEQRTKAVLAAPSGYDSLWTEVVLETDVPALIEEVRRLREALRDIATKPTFPPFAAEMLQEDAADAIGLEIEP